MKPMGTCAQVQWKAEVKESLIPPRSKPPCFSGIDEASESSEESEEEKPAEEKEEEEEEKKAPTPQDKKKKKGDAAWSWVG